MKPLHILRMRQGASAPPPSVDYPTFAEVGAQVASISAQTVAFPASVNADDLAFLVVETANEPIAAPSVDWTEITPAPVTTASGLAGRVQVFWYRCAGTEGGANVSLADAGNHALAIIFTVEGGKTTGDPTHQVGSQGVNVAGTAYAAPTITTTLSNVLVIAIFGRSNDSASTTAFSGETNASLTLLAKQFEAGTAVGNGGGFAVVTGVKETAGVVSDTTITGPSSPQMNIQFGVLSDLSV
jgi:hypothetical protein